MSRFADKTPKMEGPDQPTRTSSVAAAQKKGTRMQYRALLQTAPDAIVVADQAGRIVLVNAEAEKLFGYRRAELIGQLAESIIPERFRTQQNEQRSQFQGKSSERPIVAAQELFGLRKDGSEFPTEVRLSPLNTRQGILVSSAIRDISGRRKTEEDLRRLAAIVTSSDDAITSTTFDGVIVTWNAAAERIYGYSAQEAIGQLASMLVPKNLPDETSAMLECLKRGETVDHFETVRVRKDGKEVQIALTVSPIRDALERIVGASTIGRDISARKAAEKEMVRMEARYRGLLEAAPDAMVVVNGDGEIVLLNLQAEKRFGYSRDELLGQQVRNIIPKGFSERLIADGLRSAADALTQQIGTGIELYGRRKNGSEFPIEIMLSPLGASDGILVTAAIRDITERRRHDDELKRFAAVIESSHDAIISVDSEGEVLTWNRGATHIFGYSAEEAIGRPIVFLCPPDVPADFPSLVEKMERGEVVESFEAIRMKKDGTRIHVALTLAPIRDPGGSVIGVSKVARDVTENKKMEAMLRQAQKMEAIGQLAGGVAHDFNNLLGVILGHNGLMLERLKPDDPERRGAEAIQKAGDRAALLTRQLLAFSRKQVLQPRVLNLNTVLAGTEDMLRRLIGETVELVVLQDADLGRVQADSGQVEQIIMNLAVNARDAMPSGGKITIETENVYLDEAFAADHPSTIPGPHVMVSVSDTGCGMDAMTKMRIFEPFFTTKEFGKGTGLGLSTVYGIVKQSGGSVWVYSEVGVGTSFKIYFPRVDAVLDVLPPSENVPRIEEGSRTILIVEDEASLLEVTQGGLEDAGYAVLAAQSPADAVLIAANHLGPIHLMVTDVVMPGMSGPELARNLSAIRPEMKVLYVSGYTDDTIVRHGALEPGLAFLQKPFSPQTLARKVRDVLVGVNIVTG